MCTPQRPSLASYVWLPPILSSHDRREIFLDSVSILPKKHGFLRLLNQPGVLIVVENARHKLTHWPFPAMPQLLLFPHSYSGLRPSLHSLQTLTPQVLCLSSLYSFPGHGWTIVTSSKISFLTTISHVSFLISYMNL